MERRDVALGAICRWAYFKQADRAAIAAELAAWRVAGPVGGAFAMVAERSATAVGDMQQAFSAIST